MGNVAGALAGKHVLLTGVTGFVGEALLRLILAEVPDVRLTLLIRPKGSTPGTDRARALLGKDDLQRPRRGSRDPAGRPGLGARGRPRRRTRPAHATWTPSCTAPATSRSTRPSTRASAPTSSAPATCSTGSARPAATSTTCTSPRRTSRGAAAAPSPRAGWTTRSTSRPSWPGVSPSARVVEHQSRSTAVLTKLRSRSEREHGRAGLLTAARPPRSGAASGSRSSWCGSAPSAPAASAGPTATRSPRPSASASSRSTPGPRGPRSSGRASSSPPSSSRTPAGSRASRWPSR